MRAVDVDTAPVAINGKPIFGEEEKYALANGKTIYLPPTFKGGANDPVLHLFAQLENDFNKLEDGQYYLDLRRLVVDERGNLAYYESNGIFGSPGWGGRAFSFVSDDLKNTIDRKLFDHLNSSLKFKPATNLEGKPINVRLELPGYDIEVKGHQARLVQRSGGC